MKCSFCNKKAIFSESFSEDFGPKVVYNFCSKEELEEFRQKQNFESFQKANFGGDESGLEEGIRVSIS